MTETFNYRKPAHLSILIATTLLLLSIPLTVYLITYPKEVSIKALASGVTHYVACGDSLDSANSAVASSDSLLFQRGCQNPWTGTLSLPKSGMYVGAYGSGELPIIQSSDKYGAEAEITGSNITIENIWVQASPVDFQPNGICAGNPIDWTSGFRLYGNNITIKNSKATANYAGVYIKPGSTNNKIFSNTLLNNTMHVNTSPTAGAFGVLVWGDNNEIAYNQISGSDACDPTTAPSYRDGSAVEIYGGQNNYIHHNRADNNAAFSELGNSRSANNTYAYNLVTSSLQYSLFLNTRGANDPFGPVSSTKAYNNTVYLTGANSQGAVCYSVCSSSILSLKNNILWVNWKAAYADGPFDESNNIYWSTNGKPFIQDTTKWTIAASSVKIDPQFVSTGGDFHLKSTSPAVNSGMSLGYTTDFDVNPVPKGGFPDVGAFEYQTPSSGAGLLIRSTGKGGMTNNSSKNPSTQASAKGSTKSASASASKSATKKPPVFSFYQKLAAGLLIILLSVAIGVSVFYYLRRRKARKD